MNQIRRTFGSTNIIVAGYIAAIALAEIAGVWSGAFTGVVCHALLIPVLLSHYALAARTRYRRILPVLALAPLLRILSLTMPVEQVPRIYWYALVGAPLLIGITLTARLLGLSAAAVGLRFRLWPIQLFIALAGIPLSVITFFTLRPAPIPASGGWHSLALNATILVIFTGFVEELLFRGVLQHVAGELFGRASVFVAGALFAIMHTGSLSPGYVLVVGLVGLLFGWFVQATGSIWGVALAHGVLNVGLLLVLPRLIVQVPAAAGAFDRSALLISALLLIGAVCLLVAHVSALSAPETTSPPTSLRLVRRRAGLSHTDLARRTGIPARTIAEIEHGLCRPRPEHLRMIALALGVAPQSLLPTTVSAGRV